MAKVYISGAITETKDYKERFHKAKRKLEAEGHFVFNPVETADDVAWKHRLQNLPEPTWQDYMRADLQELACCDEVYMLKGWRESEGAKFEHLVARTVGIKIRDEE